MTSTEGCHPSLSHPLAPCGRRTRVNRANSWAQPTGADEDRILKLNRERPHRLRTARSRVAPVQLVVLRHRQTIVPPCSAALSAFIDAAGYRTVRIADFLICVLVGAGLPSGFGRFPLGANASRELNFCGERVAYTGPRTLKTKGAAGSLLQVVGWSGRHPRGRCEIRRTRFGRLRRRTTHKCAFRSL
jgi:hypothetical protein